MPFNAASPMPVRHIQFPTSRPHGLPQHSRMGQPLPSNLARTVRPQAVTKNQHPAQSHAEHQPISPVGAPGSLSVAAITAPAFQTVTAGLRSEAVREPCPAHGREPRQLPVGSSLQDATAKAQADPLLSRSVSTPVTDPSSVPGLQQLPQQLPHAVAPRPHVSWPQPVVGWPQQTLRPQINQQHTTAVSSPNSRSGVLQHQARHDAAGLLKTVAHGVGVGSARPASAPQGAAVRTHESWQQLQQPQHAQQQPQQQPQHPQQQLPQQPQQQQPQHAQQQRSGSALGQSHLQTARVAHQKRLADVHPQGEDERGTGISSKRGFNSASLGQRVTDLAPAPAAGTAPATAAATAAAAAAVAGVTARVQVEAGPPNKRSASYLKRACMQTATRKHSVVS